MITIATITRIKAYSTKPWPFCTVAVYLALYWSCHAAYLYFVPLVPPFVQA